MATNIEMNYYNGGSYTALYPMTSFNNMDSNSFVSVKQTVPGIGKIYNGYYTGTGSISHSLSTYNSTLETKALFISGPNLFAACVYPEVGKYLVCYLMSPSSVLTSMTCGFYVEKITDISQGYAFITLLASSSYSGLTIKGGSTLTGSIYSSTVTNISGTVYYFIALK